MMSWNLTQAKNLLKALEGKPLTKHERISKAIELASLIQIAANEGETRKEKAFLKEIAAMVRDPRGKLLTTKLTDQAFRSENPVRVADEIVYLLDWYGIPKFLGWGKKFGLFLFKWLAPFFPRAFVPLAKKMIRKETSRVILPGETNSLKEHLKRRNNEGVCLNINHLGEAILGEEEASHRLETYLKDLEDVNITYISVKISTLYSQIHLLDQEGTLNILQERYEALLRAAMKHSFKNAKGDLVPKFVNLDMEEYRDLDLTVKLFKQVLGKKEFTNARAGIVLQSYLPDSFPILEDLTSFATQRLSRGGAPIKVRIVKGANLAMERVEASIKGWKVPIFDRKALVDAQYKKMLEFAIRPSQINAVHIGVGSHNLFDISYALLLMAERGVKEGVTFEMLEGMAEPTRRVIQEINQGILLYCPLAKKDEFQNAVAYLVRRLDENTGPENFLRFSFDLTPASPAWKKQADFFAWSCLHAEQVPIEPIRKQNRFSEVDSFVHTKFRNEPDTDFSLAENRRWAEENLKRWRGIEKLKIPALIAGKELYGEMTKKVDDPSIKGRELFSTHLSSKKELDEAIAVADQRAKLKTLPFKARAKWLEEAASLLRKRRGHFIGAIVANVAKSFQEADVEVSEAIDFAEFYRLQGENLESYSTLQMSPKGVVLVLAPWNFPLSIPLGGILAALITGNVVIFKPAPESVLVGYELVKLLYEAGVPVEMLQFVPCQDEEASFLVKDERVNFVVLTGATATAMKLYELRSDLDLAAETGGKNSMIVTSLSDRDLAVKDIVHSAFSFSGQKCSALSLLILEEEVFNDLKFKKQLKDATESLSVGSAWDFSSKITPLIRPPTSPLKEVMENESHEEMWLLRPKVSPDKENLVFPGILFLENLSSEAVKKELFGPVIAVVKAKDLDDAIRIANSTEYGLTAGLHSLDERDHEIWLKKIIAGNCYINRGITGAVVERQPFGGTKKSQFGNGFKAGGPNYLFQFLNINQIQEEKEFDRIPDILLALVKGVLKGKDLDLFEKRASSYAFFMQRFFSKDHDPMRVLGQDNIQRYVPYPEVVLRVQKNDSLVDILSCVASAHIAACPLFLSIEEGVEYPLPEKILRKENESDELFLQRISSKDYKRVRLLSRPSDEVVKGLSSLGLWQKPAKVLMNGRIELLHYLREVSISYDYHRYGNLGDRS